MAPFTEVPIKQVYESPLPTKRTFSLSPRLQVALVAMVLVLAGVVRFAALGRLPQGLYMDEAADGLDALRATATHHYQVFYPADGGREGLWIALMSLSVRWFGPTLFATRFWSPIIGLLTILATYGLASRWMNRTAGLLASWLMASSFWHIVFSRVAFRGILLPLFVVSALYFLQVAWDATGRRGLLFSGLGGTCLGLGFYSYIPFRLMPLLGLCVLGSELCRSSGGRQREVVKRFAIWAAIGFVVALPLGIYFIGHPAEFSSRMSQVSVFGAASPGKLMIHNFVLSLKMLVLRGDENWRHNLPGFPELGYVAAIFFVIGVAVVWRRRRVLLIWLLLMLLPAVLTNEGVPHALRSIGALPAAIMIVAAGLDWVLERRLIQSRPALKYAVAGLIVMAGAGEVSRYFVLWAPTPQVQQAYQAEQLLAAQTLKATPDSKTVFVVVQAPGYNWKGNAVIANVGGESLLLPPHAAITLYIAAGRRNTIYVSGEDVSNIDLARFGCAANRLPALRVMPENQLRDMSDCTTPVAVLRLTGVE